MKLLNVKASVVIATYKREDHLVRTIECVWAQEFDEFELIVVDQSRDHTEATDKYLREQTDTRFRYFRVSPPSLPAARNFALKQARGEIVIFIDDDVELYPGFIEAHCAGYGDDETVAAVCGRVTAPGEPKSTQPLRTTRAGIDRGGLDLEFDTWITGLRGCNMSFRKSVLEAISGFDTNFQGVAHREESDAAYRLRRLGYKIAFRHSAALVHIMAQTGGAVGVRNSARDQPLFYQNETLFFFKHQPVLLLPYFWLMQLRYFVFNRSSLVSGKTPQRLRAFVAGFWGGVHAYRRPIPIVAKELSTHPC